MNKLSKGCQLCQQGRWLCIYLTYMCNAECHFCPSPFKNDFVNSAFGNKKEEILSYLVNSDFKGISFSGGDPFMVFDRLLEWHIFFKKHLPDYYYWVYTNGLAVDKNKLEQLAKEGMNEIRFNIAATEYLSPQIWERIEIARKLFPYVSVEIPSIKNDSKILSQAIDKIDKIGIDYLNLHDYIIGDKDDKANNEKTVDFILNKVIKLKYALSSVKNTENIIDLSAKKNYNFQINHCSMQRKEEQMLQRRLKTGGIFSNTDYDIMMKDGTISNFYYFPNTNYDTNLMNNLADHNFRTTCIDYLIKKNNIKDFQNSNKKLIRISYIPQMELNQEKILLKIENSNKLHYKY